MAFVLVPVGACHATGVRATFDEGAIVRGDPTVHELALVFTGGEFGEGTEHILDTLERAAVPAAFFVTGAFLAPPGRAELVRRMVKDGHYVGPHSDAHPLYCPFDDREHTLVTRAFFASDLEANIAALRALGSLAPGQPVWFIPPYRVVQPRPGPMGARARRHDVLLHARQRLESRLDPRGRRTIRVVAADPGRHIAYEQRDPHGLNGFILLLHLGSGRRDPMHSRLGALIDALHARGYRFVRVDELLARARSR